MYILLLNLMELLSGLIIIVRDKTVQLSFLLYKYGSIR